MIHTVGRIVLIVVVLLFGFGLIADNWAQDVPSPLKTEKSGKFGTYLVDSKGMTLYIFDKDKEAGKSTCYSGCAKAWPLFAPEADDPSPMAPSASSHVMTARSSTLIRASRCITTEKTPKPASLKVMGQGRFGGLQSHSVETARPSNVRPAPSPLAVIPCGGVSSFPSD